MAVSGPGVVLFFDNEDNNFKCEDKFRCNNVIQIKIADSFPTLSVISKQYENNPTILQLRVQKYNSGSLIPLIGDINGNNVGYVHLFDEVSGIPIQQIQSLTQVLDDPNVSSKISTVIMDFDRTFTMIEGVVRLPTMKHFANALQNPKCTPENLVEFYMGGAERLDAMKSLLLKLIEKNIKLIILTNNPSVDLINDFIQNYVYNYGVANNLYELITTHLYMKPLNPNLSKKLNIVSDSKKLCNETYINDSQFIANNLTTIGFNIHNMGIINSIVIANQASNTSMSGGYRTKKHKKTKRTKKHH